MQEQDVEDPPDFIVKLVMVGDSGVGKSNLVLRWTENTFYDHMTPTIGVEYALKTIDIEGKRIKIQIWDTAGHERFQAITSAYYRSTQGCIVVYDVTSGVTFASLNRWLNEITEHSPRDICSILIGNKSDLVAQRAVSTDEGRDYAMQHDMFFLETSAKDSVNIEEAFTELVTEIVKRMSKIELRRSAIEETPAGVAIEIPVANTEKKDSCC
jgi:small GTP-binding protein